MMSNTVENLEGDDLQSPPPPSKNNEKKPINQLKPNKGRVDVKRHRKLTSEVWNSFEFMDPDENGSLTSRLPDFDPNVFRELLASAVVKHELPFQFVEYDGIRKCFNYLHPEVKVVSRNTVKNDIMKMYRMEKLKIRDTLSCIPGRICLTSDCWTSITIDGYMSLTAHFIDSSWNLQKVILNFSFLAPPHTGLALSDHIFSLLKDWGIQKKVFSVTLDNASSNDAMVDFLKYELDLVSQGAYFHVRCCAHIMNLIVQDGLKEVDDAIIKVRDSVKYFRGSQARRQRFLSSVAHVELQSSRGLQQDVPTRWNSTYIMLESVLYYKKSFIHLQKTDANYLHCPTNEEWGRIERTFKFLKVFYEVTCAFSVSKYTTTNLYFANVLMVRVLLHKEKDSHDITVMAFVVVLDPRYKFQLVEWGYEKAYGEGYKSELAIIKDKLFSLFKEYVDESNLNKSKVGQPKNGSLDSQEESQDVLDAASASLLMDFDDFSTKVTSQAVKSELECYLEEKLMPRVKNINILDYWRTHEIRYPTLARMARDILAILISTVASESAFSIGGRVLDAYRTQIESQLGALCGAIMMEKMEDREESNTENEVGADESASRVT
ncbi:hypothetical protein L6452_08267 [Arctium lappa]|uniref:Uncharacterized protein n=1 Tax=Arctium lappa TaxID=4217 RepID=A0ACB9DHW5_ARCLA|nr:hypothetical protein L6452_08267 [Arctium lappa]